MIYQFQVGEHRHTLKTAGPDIIRMLAHPSQVPALEKLALERPRESVQVCSMSLINDGDAISAGLILERLEQRAHISPECGGFMTITEGMLAALMMGAYPFDFTPDEKYVQYMSIHPFMSQQGHFSFGNLMPQKTMILLNFIWDIRRFRDHTGNSTLLKEFKLDTPDEFYRLCRMGQADKSSLRPAMAFNAWNLELLGELSFYKLKQAPFAWAHREYFQVKNSLASKLDANQLEWEARYQVTCRFLEFVEKLWTTDIGLGTFVPEQFFTGEHELDVYKNLIK